MCKNLPFPRRSHINPYKSPSAETSSIYKLKNPKQLNQFKRNIPKNPFSCEPRTQINRQTNSGAKLVTTLFLSEREKRFHPDAQFSVSQKTYFVSFLLTSAALRSALYELPLQFRYLGLHVSPHGLRALLGSTEWPIAFGS